MKVSIHSLAVEQVSHTLGQVLVFLDKAVAYAEAKKFDVSVLVTARLAPDMLPFTNQIQIACDAVKFGVARLSGVDAPKFADDETSLADLRQRVQKTIDFIQSVPAAQIDGTETKDVVVPRRDGSMTMKGETYLKTFVLPNFFFHVTTAYALLRHNGVELGKADFLGPMQPSPAA